MLSHNILKSFTIVFFFFGKQHSQHDEHWFGPGPFVLNMGGKLFRCKVCTGFHL